MHTHTHTHTHMCTHTQHTYAHTHRANHHILGTIGIQQTPSHFLTQSARPFLPDPPNSLSGSQSLLDVPSVIRLLHDTAVLLGELLHLCNLDTLGFL